MPHSRGSEACIIQDGQPIAFASKSLTDTETRYANIKRELLAIVYGCEKFHTYLYGRTFVMETDHKPPRDDQPEKSHSSPCMTPKNAPPSAAIRPDHNVQTRQGNASGGCPQPSPVQNKHRDQVRPTSRCHINLRILPETSHQDHSRDAMRTPSSQRGTDSPWMVGRTDKVMSPEQPDSTGVSEMSYPSTATSSPRVNKWSFHRPAETASLWTSMEAMQVSIRLWTWPEHVFTGPAWKQTSPTTSNGAWHVSKAATYQSRCCTPTRSLPDLG